MADSSKAPIIVIKRKRVVAAGAHGGAWKVAYADFVTAMMAFFLVMWLVSQSKPVKASVAGYFRDPGAFDSHGDGILEGGKQAPVLDAANHPAARAPRRQHPPAAEQRVRVQDPA